MQTLTIEQLQECVYELDRRVRYLTTILSTPRIPADEKGGIELAQKITHLSISRIRTLASEGRIPHRKRGKRLIFKRSELLDWLNEGNPMPY